jgi:hypothetical protein
MTDYGARHTDAAIRSFCGARKDGQDRPQDINTPPLIVDAILRVWPEGIALDPCDNATSITHAKTSIKWPENGLAVDWPDYTYVNPPYKQLRPWMQKAVRYKEHMLLIPVRTNRRWWCVYERKATAICRLKPFAFLGHKQSFPSSLVMLYYGSRPRSFADAFAPLGEIGRFV